MASAIATAAAAAVLRATAEPVIKHIAGALKIGADKARANFTDAFKNHLELTYTRCANVRTIFTGERFVPLSSIYVNLRLSSGNKTCRDEDLVLNCDKLGNTVVIGTGGAGKTMLMRHVALLLYEKPVGKIPLFVELRNIPKHDPKDFYKTIFNMITPERRADQFSIFLEGLRSGLFVLLLDGLDEVKPTDR
ncbi:MAG: NACHT domain-containing protein, partial [Proteobacteria bacterium]|nr:NACHT domain-containing protein [Pseudomonadota bacterium]